MTLIAYFLTLLFLTIYSYSQIDLNLTLSSNQTYQFFQNQLIQLGYFNRPISTLIYLLLLLLFFSFYLIFLYQVKHKKLILKDIFQLIVISCVILLFSYPAFSHDLFNYMFDARIVTKYHLNPYYYSALDFPDDLWIRFMHWTHRVYPYGPLWLVITLPLSYLGYGKFVLTLAFFKLFFVIFHLGNTYIIYKLLTRINPKYSLYGVVFYALNPLVIFESLVSPHNDVVMLFFLLLTIYLVVAKRNRLLSIISLLFSGAVKFTTLVLLPLFLIPNKSYKVRLKLTLFFLILPVLIQTIYREPYPWYFIILIGVGALLGDNIKISIIVSGLTFGLLLRYAPYLYYGDYSKTVSLWQTWLFLFPFIISLLIACYNALKTHSWKLS